MPPTPTKPKAPDVNELLAQQISQNKSIQDSILALLEAFDAQRKKEMAYDADTDGLAFDLQVIKTPCRLRSLWVYNAGVGQNYLQAHNRPSEPTEGANARLVLPVPADSIVTFDLGADRPDSGLRFSAGLYLCASSTNVTKTRLLTKDFIIACSFSYDD